MKKVICLIALSLLAGCASAPSDYNQGCRDGVNGMLQNRNESNIDKYCDGLDSLRSEKRDERVGGRRL